MNKPSNTSPLDKTFDPASIEQRWQAHWEDTGAFWPDRPHAEPYTIVLPPPNVTGTLHIGHALDQTLQDILIRWQRLKGRDARWVVGTDHAGIATQMVVERQLAEKGQRRQDLGRKAFLEKVWEWKAESGGAITQQMRRLGTSCDWRNEHFTMDEGLSQAVTHAFVTLHQRGLIYRDKRLVNWDPEFQSAISDLEVETRETPGHFWHLRYPLADGSGHLVVATTRPETMLGDTAVAVNPEDERYRHLIGQMVAHPLTNRQIPIIGDDWADPEFGSGCVKITPAHDFNDWAVYERHREIGWINILDAKAAIVDSPDMPAAYRGLDRFEARKKIVADLDALGLLDHIEDKPVQVPHGDRSGAIIEPWLTDQWYVDAATMAKAAREAVSSGKTKFVPATWEKTYYNWLDNIQPWCISRQLWWGHRIPAWFGPKPSPKPSGDEQPPIFVAAHEEDALAQARKHYGTDRVAIAVEGDNGEPARTTSAAGDATEDTTADTIFLRRDPDVLDTWFSSGLWPFATQGWPEDTTDLHRFYPTDVLVTAFDIIFFWVARMMMQGMELTGTQPFETIYIHGLVRDSKGQKMSKSRGNTVDPLELIDRYGADALRFTMAASESQGRDVKFDEKRVEGYRNFATKLWNAVRFAQGQGISAGGKTQPEAKLAINQWVLHETNQMLAATERALQTFRFDLYAQGIYQFVWSRFCDWYLELIKPILSEDGDDAEETRQVAGWVIDQILIALHPAMPFITEELWHAMGHRQTDLVLGQWPVGKVTESSAAKEINWLIELVSAIRSARTELNVPPSAKVALHLMDESAKLQDLLQRHLPSLQRLARITEIGTGRPAGGMAQLVVENVDYALPLEGVIDLAVERQRLEKAALSAEKEAASLSARLANRGFIERAKAEAVEKARKDHAVRMAQAAHLRAALDRLG